MRKHETLIMQVTAETLAHRREKERADVAERQLRDLDREFQKMKVRAEVAEAELASIGGKPQQEGQHG